MEPDQALPPTDNQELPSALQTLGNAVKGVAAKARAILLSYQAYAISLFEQFNLVVIEKSRRIGLTWAVAFYAVMKASRAGGTDFLYISYSQEMTREFIDAVAMWAKAILPAAAEVGEFLFDDQVKNEVTGEIDTKQIKAFRVTFASGKEVVGLSSAPRSIRGKKGIVCIDEAAFVDNLAELLKAALALLMWGGKVIVLSTHDGVDNPFNQLIDEIKSKKKKGATWRITLADAMAAGLYERICLVTGKEPSAEGRLEWEADVRGSYGDDADEELDCNPKAGAGSYLPPELVVAAEHPDANKPDLYAQGGCFGGRDIAAGRGGDNAAMWVFEMVGNVLWLRERRQGNKIGILEQEEIFNGQFKRFRIVRYGVDQTGMGEGEVVRAQRTYGSLVEGVIFSPTMRLAMATAMKRRFEEGTIRIDADPAIRADFRAIKKTKGAGNTVRLVNDGDVHADMFWACGLACLVADGDVLVYHGYQAAPPQQGKFDERGGYDVRREFHMRADDGDASPRRFGVGTW